MKPWGCLIRRPDFLGQNWSELKGELMGGGGGASVVEMDAYSLEFRKKCDYIPGSLWFSEIRGDRQCPIGR